MKYKISKSWLKRNMFPICVGFVIVGLGILFSGIVVLVVSKGIPPLWAWNMVVVGGAMSAISLSVANFAR